jgi:Fic-DOC domain mobile mystery protein B
MKLTYPDGATPLDPDSAQGLIPGLANQGELNEFEARNIAEAFKWARRSTALKRDLLTNAGLSKLHRRMFDRTWDWAGRFRWADTQIGVPWYQIPVALKNLCDDVAYQLAGSPGDWDDFAVRFHHRLVLIHPFPNGNGRHSRLATELLLQFNRQAPFTWGSESLVRDGAARAEYLGALREADGGEFGRLTVFCRS